MEDPEIKKLLQAQTGRGERRGWSCPDEILLASYVAHGLGHSDRNTIEAHIADCNFCLHQVAFLTQSATWQDSEQVPPDLLAEARKLVRVKRDKDNNWGWRWAAATAAFAGIILIVGGIVLQRRSLHSELAPDKALVAQASPEPMHSPRLTVGPGPSDAESTPALKVPKVKSPEPPEVRSTTAEELLPKLISPRNGGVVRRSDLTFRWAPVADATFYDVRITSAAGDVVFEKQTEDTELKPGSAAPLLSGTKYFATIRAHLPLGRAVKSGVVSFRLTEK